MNRPTLSLIAAVARNDTIGKGNALLWHEPDDQKHFRRVTMGCPVIMGRKTWDSLPARFRPLPGRRNIVLTRAADWRADGAETAPSLEDALDRLAGVPKAFVIGGAEVYALALPRATHLHLTWVDTEADGADAFFPRFDPREWREIARAAHPADARHEYGFTFVDYKRVPGLSVALQPLF